MNFTAHFFTLNKENPYIILGSILPDLVNDFSKIYNYSIENKFVAKLKTNKLLIQGIELHLKADDIFHKHLLFEEMQKTTKSILKEEIGNSVKRKYVIAHVLVELLIDQYIINNNKEILNNLYSKLEKIKIEKVNSFFKTINIEENTSHFQRNFTSFMEFKFLNRLKENEGVIFTLDRVFSKKLNYNFLENEKQWDLALERIKPKIEKSILEILEDVKLKLYD